MKKIREEIAAINDGEILVYYYRNKHGNPYMSLPTAKRCVISI